jgi:hypothetical protein
MNTPKDRKSDGMETLAKAIILILVLMILYIWGMLHGG